MKHWVDKYSFKAGLLFRGTCHGPSDGAPIGGSAVGWALSAVLRVGPVGWRGGRDGGGGWDPK